MHLKATGATEMAKHTVFKESSLKYTVLFWHKNNLKSQKTNKTHCFTIFYLNHLLTYTSINHMPLLHFSFCDGCMIRTGHLNHPRWTHDRDRVLGQVPKNLFLFAEDRNLWERNLTCVSYAVVWNKAYTETVSQNNTNSWERELQSLISNALGGEWFYCSGHSNY